MLVNEVASPYSIAEAVAFLKRQNQVLPITAGTRALIDPEYKSQPCTVLSLSNIKELLTVSRTDRFLEIGAALSLNRIVSLPLSASLDPLKKAISTIGTNSIRNRATLGGNIGSPFSFGSTFPMLCCLEASLETRSASGSKWIRVQDMVSPTGQPAPPKNAFITRIRLPLREWDFSCVVRKGNSLLPGEHNTTFAALANIEKQAVSELRVIVAGSIQVRCRDLELSLGGKRLPLAAKEIEAARHQFMENAIEAGMTPSIGISSADTLRTFLQNLNGAIL